MSVDRPAFDDPLYSGQFSEFTREVNAIVLAGQARDLENSTAHVLDVATQLADSLPGSFEANVEGLGFSSDQAMLDINARRIRLEKAFSPIEKVGDGDEIPPQYKGEIQAAINSAWAEAFTVAGLAEAMPSLAAELSKVLQNLSESPGYFKTVATAVGDGAAGVTDALAGIVDKVLKAFTGKLWPWLIVAGVVFLLVEFAPELRLLAAGLIRAKTPGVG
jgi:hypothetical protein